MELNQITLPVKDMDAAVNFYLELGREFNSEVHHSLI